MILDEDSDLISRFRKRLGVAQVHHKHLETYSFFTYGKAYQRNTKPARMACAAPLVQIDDHGPYVPPVAPTAGGNCENIPDKHRDLFFAEEGNEQGSPQVGERRDFLWGHYCHDCPVREQCFEYAVKYIDWGIWAGTTETERSRLRAAVQTSDDPKSLPPRAHKAIEEGKRRLRKGLKPLA